ncbi:MAG: adenosine deaminase [Acidobacteriaceae bacterium]|nr:adenosine deaminase [Acidobacteriaceae bacterium]
MTALNCSTFAFALLTANVFAQPALAPTHSRSTNEALLNHQFAELRNSPPELYAFLLRMPKGGDLHNHLAGAVYAERFLEEAAKQSLCIDPRTLSIVGPEGENRCASGDVPATRSLNDNHLFALLIDSLSMRDFVPGSESAHDHFFAAFEKFSAVAHGHDGENLADVVRRAAEQNESYLELMVLTAGSAITGIANEIGFDGDFDATRQKLLQRGLEQQAKAIRTRVDEMEKARVQALACDSEPVSPPCRVAVRYIFQVLRGSPKESVFAQLLTAFILASSDPRVVAINFVQPEDSFTSMRDYHLHMQMVDYAKRLYPGVHISLHAGELAPGLVPPEGLRFHIREAVQLGHAERIGHGVDIMYENEWFETMRLMKERHIDVEINLTSNDQILGVKGKDHPFPIYRKYGVPVTISTDDEGVARTHLTQEYQRAVLTYSLSYADVKQIVRNSLEYSFVPGDSFWKDASYGVRAAPCGAGRHTETCEKFIQANEKARLQADLEDRFDAFERDRTHW